MIVIVDTQVNIVAPDQVIWIARQNVSIIVTHTIADEFDL